MSLLLKNLAHAKAAYEFAMCAVPSKATKFPCNRYGFRFEGWPQAHSMIIELGWAFFCRYESCLEDCLKSKGVQLSKKLTLADWFRSQNVDIPERYQEGLSCYRQIRNKLHHEGGAAISGAAGEEIHILPGHMENFYSLFVWVGEQIATLDIERTPWGPHSGATEH